MVTPMRVLVCGAPEWTDSDTVKMVLDGQRPDEVIHNDAPTGVDAAAAQWCAENSVPAIVVPIDASRGAEAEAANIQEMLAQNPDLVMSFTIMDPANPDQPGQLLAHDLAFDAGLAIDYSVLDLRPIVEAEDPSSYFVCSLCGLTIKQALIGEENPHWSDLDGDLVCTGSTEARPDHVPILPA